MKNLKELLEKFKEIKDMGWVNSNRAGSTGIGKTFEDLLNIDENNSTLADFKGIEVKTQRSSTSSMITLFTKSPSYPRSVNSELRKQFGRTSTEHNNHKILFTTIDSTKFTTADGIYDYQFKIEIDELNERLILIVKDAYSDEIKRNDIYWTFKDIKNSLTKKLINVAHIKADERIYDGNIQFNYNSITFLSELTFDNLIAAIKCGDLKIDIRLGVYASGRNEGKLHDYGTGFRMSYGNLLKYVEKIEIK